MRVYFTFNLLNPKKIEKNAKNIKNLNLELNWIPWCL